jgi:uncharacterized protein
MAGSSLLTLIDDIATLLDDISVLSKVAVQKTAGVLGDDLALNAQQVTGLTADRELPVVRAVAKGSLWNKAILVPGALLISFVANWAVLPLLMFGGIYLCYEGFEKILHKFLHAKEEADHHDELVKALVDQNVDLVALEKERIKGAIRTDFILSAEIIVITLGAVAHSNYITQISVLIAISIIMTVGVYGLVAGIVKLDDWGLKLSRSKGIGQATKRWFGGLLLAIAPRLLNVLSVLGTIAMFAVGGGIVVHGIPQLQEVVHHWSEQAGELTHLGSVAEHLFGMLLNTATGLACGAVALAIVEGARRLWRKPS